MTTHQSTASDEAQIRQLIEQWAQALYAKDLNTLMSYYTPDILTFDIRPPLQYQRDSLPPLRLAPGGGRSASSGPSRALRARTVLRSPVPRSPLESLLRVSQREPLEDFPLQRREPCASAGRQRRSGRIPPAGGHGYQRARPHGVAHHWFAYATLLHPIRG